MTPRRVSTFLQSSSYAAPANPFLPTAYKNTVWKAGSNYGRSAMVQVPKYSNTNTNVTAFTTFGDAAPSGILQCIGPQLAAQTVNIGSVNVGVAVGPIAGIDYAYWFFLAKVAALDGSLTVYYNSSAELNDTFCDLNGQPTGMLNTAFLSTNITSIAEGDYFITEWGIQQISDATSRTSQLNMDGNIPPVQNVGQVGTMMYIQLPSSVVLLDTSQGANNVLKGFRAMALAEGVGA